MFLRLLVCASAILAYFLLLFGDGISNVEILNAVIIWLESMVSVQ